MPDAGKWVAVDPFDLPEWLGVDDVTWCPDEGVRGHLVPGTLRSERDGSVLACDLLAADVAFPRPVVDDGTRTGVHQAWRHGQVLLLERDGRLTVVAPGTEHTADGVLEMLRRLAKAVGAPHERFSARLRA